MLRAALDFCVSEIADLEAVLLFNRRLREEAASAFGATWSREVIRTLPDDGAFRRLEASMIIGSLYASWEKYIESSLAEVLDIIFKTERFTGLSLVLQDRYRRGFAYILENNHKRRFSNLSTRSLVDSYYALLHDDPGGRAVPEALIHHKENLRFAEVSELARRLGIFNVDVWLHNDREVQAFVIEELSGSNTLIGELRNLVDLRNDLVHGNGCSIPGSAELQRYCSMIRALVVSVNCLFSRRAFEALRAAGRTEDLGCISETFRKHSIAVIRSVGGTSLSVGDEVYVFGENRFDRVVIVEIEVEDQPCYGLSSLNEIEVGLRLSAPKAREGYHIARVRADDPRNVEDLECSFGAGI